MGGRRLKSTLSLQGRGPRLALECAVEKGSYTQTQVCAFGVLCQEGYFLLKIIKALYEPAAWSTINILVRLSTICVMFHFLKAKRDNNRRFILSICKHLAMLKGSLSPICTGSFFILPLCMYSFPNLFLWDRFVGFLGCSYKPFRVWKHVVMVCSWQLSEYIPTKDVMVFYPQHWSYSYLVIAFAFTFLKKKKKLYIFLVVSPHLHKFNAGSSLKKHYFILCKVVVCFV